MASVKIERLNHLIQEEISMIIMREIKNQDLKFITITGVETTSDLSFAKVYYTILDESKKDSVEEALKKSSSFIRTKLAERIEVRHTPELIFKYDTSIAYGEHIERIINKIHEQ